jgi:hypothetical protein
MRHRRQKEETEKSQNFTNFEEKYIIKVSFYQTQKELVSIFLT